MKTTIYEGKFKNVSEKLIFTKENLFKVLGISHVFFTIFTTGDNFVISCLLLWMTALPKLGLLLKEFAPFKGEKNSAFNPIALRMAKTPIEFWPS